MNLRRLVHRLGHAMSLRRQETKRTREIEAVRTDPHADETQQSGPSERSLRQRTDAAAASSATVSSSAAAFSFLARPAGRPSFMGLAVVERQLIMQCLDFTSLTRISRVCRRLRDESLQPPSGRFIPALTGRLAPMGILGLESHLWVLAVQRTCRLLQAHVPMVLRAYINSQQIPAEFQSVAVTSLLLDAAPFQKLHHLELEAGVAGDPLAIALQFLSSPVVQSIRSVQFPPGYSMNLVTLRHALWQLPALTAIRLSSPSTFLLFDVSGYALAKIRQCTWKLDSRDFRELQHLSAMSSLETLVLDMEGAAYADPQVQAIAFPSLTALTLRYLRASHAQVRALFSQKPALRELTIENVDSVPLLCLLLGAGDIGLLGLPELRRCVMDCTRIQGSIAASALNRFLHRCPQVESVVLDVSRTQPNFAMMIMREFSTWGPPLRIEFGACGRRPPLSADDDEVLAQPSNV